MEESGCVGLIIRFVVWIYFGFKEISYQLWGGQRYDTLEIIQDTLSSSMVRNNWHYQI